MKQIDSYVPKERYQTDTVNLSSYVSGDFEYVNTMIDHFTKYGWFIQINDKKQKISWLCLKMSYYHNVIYLFKLIMVHNLKTICYQSFVNKKYKDDFWDAI